MFPFSLKALAVIDFVRVVFESSIDYRLSFFYLNPMVLLVTGASDLRSFLFLVAIRRVARAGVLVPAISVVVFGRLGVGIDGEKVGLGNLQGGTVVGGFVREKQVELYL